MKILFIDNYDSFTYNIVQFFGTLPCDIEVFRNNNIDVEKVRRIRPDKIIVSPGPCTPNESGVSNAVIREFYKDIPILGVCLGHQCIGHVFGATVERNWRIMHGKTSEVFHSGDPLFKDMSNPFTATRYHSLVIRKDTLPEELEMIAWTKDDEIMAVRHKAAPLYGVQFHPESVLTPEGQTMMRNFFYL